MKPLRWMFWRADILRTLGETMVVALLLTFGLLWFAPQVPRNTLGQGFMLILSVFVFWCALRLKYPPSDSRLNLVKHELAASVSLSLLIGGGIPAVVWGSGWWDRLAKANFGATGVVLMLLSSGMILLFMRGSLGALKAWNSLRRKRMLWALTNAHMMIVFILVLLLVILLAYQALSAPGFIQNEAATPNWGPELVDFLARTAFPLVGIAAVVLGAVVLILLPPSAIFSYFVSRRLTRRLESLAATADAMRQGELAARVPVEGEDEVARLQAVFNDMAAELEQATKAIQVERDKVLTLLQSQRELVANVSHELRTPVATIRSYLESILDGNKEIDLDIQKDLGLMQAEIMRLQSLIDDLFTLSRLEVNNLEMDIRPTDIGRLVQRRAEAMKPLAWQTGRIELVAKAPSKPVTALADPGRLEQALVNLIRNGLRHTPPGGIIALSVTETENWALIEVQDTGTGISPDDINHIWERFYRSQEARQLESRGAGLGLALVKELVEAMQGRIEVESEIGQGSCFSLRLPRA